VLSPSWIALLETDTVHLRGRDGPLALPFSHRLVFMHKPPGVISERKPGKNNVYDLLPKDVAHQELGSFGRLDRCASSCWVLAMCSNLELPDRTMRGCSDEPFCEIWNVCGGGGSISLRLCLCQWMCLNLCMCMCMYVSVSMTVTVHVPVFV
jgi:hypothetical protein